mmetsp:Transcript_59557/g.145972  ORF Transcript_59557/g.145972 Transcript_59557/m.145972 type:complete len:1590 (+) Transcript_59557:309-5078(+)
MVDETTTTTKNVSTPSEDQPSPAVAVVEKDHDGDVVMTEEQVEEEEETVLTKLVILPPLQKGGTGQTEKELSDAIPLPPIRPEEPVASIKTALQEVCGYAHITNYRLVVVNDTDGNNGGDGKKDTAPTQNRGSSSSKKLPGAPSPYTGPEAVVSFPVGLRTLQDTTIQQQDTTAAATTTADAEGGGLENSNSADQNILDDFGDLSLLESNGVLKDGSAFRIVLERYDAATVRDHVVRLRTLLDGNAPTALSLLDDEEEGAGAGKNENGSAVADPDDSSQMTNEHTTGTNGADAVNNGKKKTEEDAAAAAKKFIPPSSMPLFGPNKSIHPDTNDLKNFFYYACGEDPSLYLPTVPGDGQNSNNTPNGGSKSSKKKGKKKGQASKNGPNGSSNGSNHGGDSEESLRELLPRLNELEEKTRISCTIRYSGFHPPPRFRQLMGDIAYFETTLPDGEVVFVTATPLGFYVNNSSAADGEYKFDPRPSNNACFSHELLDCLLQYSSSFSGAWQEAVETAQLRNELTAKINEDGPFLSFFRVATRGDLPGYKTPAIASAAEGIDALINTPSWLVPIPRAELDKANSWNRNCEHNFNPARTEDELSNSFGVDLRGGSTRDWNEELQVAREMPTEDLVQRIDRARLLNKVLSDFGEAVIQGVKAICEGRVQSMNPNEPARSQVFLHNNIFFSRAIDGGVETFKISRGDRAARKAASRDLSCLGVLHRMERTDIHTLGTIVVDYMGTRYVCQSILPGILSGEKTHTLLYGSVEAGMPLVWDKEMHEILEKSIGKGLLIASRPMPRDPLTEKRNTEVNAAKIASPHYVELNAKKTEKDEEGGLSPTVNLCAPIEMKGIRGSDQRMYVLDVTRLTPRDANWIPKEIGGTGCWEAIERDDRDDSNIPVSLDDDEWTVAVLRSELVTSFAQMKMSKHVREKRDEQAKKSEKEAADSDKNAEGDTDKEKKEKDEEERKSLEAEKLEYLKSLRFNVNVFLPDMKSLEGINDEAQKQIVKDEEMVREAAEFLWNDILPGLTVEVRQGAMQNVPHDGKSLTELIHQRGINCRYMGRLASLAILEEEKDHKEDEMLKSGSVVKPTRKRMPVFWLELLECEMVARAAKHVLDRYLIADGANVARSPAQTIASFLSALVSEREETAAETEKRTEKVAKDGEPDEDDFNILTFYEAGGGGDAGPRPIRDRFEVWKDIEEEIGRRFRYKLTLFNRRGKDNGRAIHTPLLRRICQRTGVRLVARSYDLGGSSFCGARSAGFQIAASSPISALDIVDIVPLMKHSAAHGEGFIPCGTAPALGLPPLHISLVDARNAIEGAHIHHSNKSLSRALDLAQEAAALYQRVTDSSAHPGVVRCMDLMATILFDAGEPELAAANGARALGLMVQVNGFDSPDVINLHFILFQFYVTSQNFAQAAKHIRAAIYLMDLVGGPHHFELSNAYHKYGSVYHQLSDFKSAMACFDEASDRVSSDRFLEGIINKSSAGMHADQKDFKVAVMKEKRAYQIFLALLGPNHEFTKQSDAALKRLTSAAVEQGSKMAKVKNIKQEEAAAAIIANQIAAEEAAKDEQLRQKNKSGQKKKKNNSKGKKPMKI